MIRRSPLAAPAAAAVTVLVSGLLMSGLMMSAAAQERTPAQSPPASAPGAPPSGPAAPPPGLPPAEADGNRFSYHRLADGFARLDLRTGQVSLCGLRSSGWACQAAPDDRAAFEAEISRLQADNVALKKALLDRGLPLPSGVKPDVPATTGEAGRTTESEFDRALGFIERAWRRLIEMIEGQSGAPGKT